MLHSSLREVIWLYTLGATWEATSEPRLYTVTVSHPWAGERPISPACSHITVTDVRAFPPGPLRSQNSQNRHRCWQSTGQRETERNLTAKSWQRGFNVSLFFHSRHERWNKSDCFGRGVHSKSSPLFWVQSQDRLVTICSYLQLLSWL